MKKYVIQIVLIFAIFFLTSQKTDNHIYIKSSQPNLISEVKSLSVTEIKELITLRDRLYYYTPYLDSLKFILPKSSRIRPNQLFKLFENSKNIKSNRDPLFNTPAISQFDDLTLFKEIKSDISGLVSNQTLYPQQFLKLLNSSGGSMSAFLNKKDSISFNIAIESIKNGQSDLKNSDVLFQKIIIFSYIVPILCSPELLSLATIKTNLKDLSAEDYKNIYILSRGLKLKLTLLASFITNLPENSALIDIMEKYFYRESKIFRKYQDNILPKGGVNSATLKNQRLALFNNYYDLVMAADNILKQIILVDVQSQINAAENIIVDRGMASLDTVFHGLLEKLNADNDLKAKAILPSSNQIEFNISDHISMIVEVPEGSYDRLTNLNKISVSGEIFIKIKNSSKPLILENLNKMDQPFGIRKWACEEEKLAWRKDSLKYPNFKNYKLDTCSYLEKHAVCSLKKQLTGIEEKLKEYAANSTILIKTGLKVHGLNISRDSDSDFRIFKQGSKDPIKVKVSLANMGINGRWALDESALKKLSSDLGFSSLLGVKIIQIYPDFEKGDITFKINIPWLWKVNELVGSNIIKGEDSNFSFTLSQLKNTEKDFKKGIETLIKQKFEETLKDLNKSFATRLQITQQSEVIHIDSLKLIYEQKRFSGDSINTNLLIGNMTFKPVFLNKINGVKCSLDPMSIQFNLTHNNSNDYEFKLSDVTGIQQYSYCIGNFIDTKLNALVDSTFREIKKVQILNAIEFTNFKFSFNNQRLELDVIAPSLMDKPFLLAIDENGIDVSALETLVKRIVEKKAWDQVHKSLSQFGICGKKNYTLPGTYFGYEIQVVGTIDCSNTNSSLALALSNDSDHKVGTAQLNIEGELDIAFDERQLAALCIPRIDLSGINAIFKKHITLERPKFENDRFYTDIFFSLPSFGIPPTKVCELILNKNGDLSSDCGEGGLEKAILTKIVAHFDSLNLLDNKSIDIAGIGSIKVINDNFMLDASEHSVDLSLTCDINFPVPARPFRLTMLFKGSDGFSIPIISDLDITNYINSASTALLPGFNAQFNEVMLGFNPIRVEGSFTAKIASIFEISETKFKLSKNKFEVSLSPTIPLPDLPVGPFFYLINGTIGINTDKKVVSGKGLIAVGATPADARGTSEIVHLNSEINISYRYVGDLDFNGSLVLMRTLPIMGGKGAISFRKGTAEMTSSTQGVLVALFDFSSDLKIDAKTPYYRSTTSFDLLGITGANASLEGYKYGRGFLLDFNTEYSLPFSKASGYVQTLVDLNGPSSILKNTTAGLSWTAKPISGSVDVDYYRVQAVLKAFGIKLGVEVPTLQDLDLSIMYKYLLEIFDLEVDLKELKSLRGSFQFGNGSFEGKTVKTKHIDSQTFTTLPTTRKILDANDQDHPEKQVNQNKSFKSEYLEFSNLSIAPKQFKTFRQKTERDCYEISLKTICRTVNVEGANWCQKFFIDKNKVLFKNHLKSPEFDYLFNRLTAGSPHDGNECSKFNPEVLDIVMPNNHLDSNINISTWSKINKCKLLLVRTPISPALLKTPMVGRSSFLSFLSERALRAHPELLDTTSISIPNPTISTDKFSFRINMLLHENKMKLFLSYELDYVSKDTLSTEENNLIIEFMKNVLLPIDNLNNFRKQFERVEGFPTTESEIASYIESKSDDIEFRRILDNALVSYMTSLGEDLREDANVPVNSSEDNDYKVKFQQISTRNDDLIIVHDITDESDNTLELNKNFSLQFYNDDVLNTLLPRLTSTNFKAKIMDYKNELQGNGILGKHLLFKSTMEQAEKEENAFSQKYGKISDYYLFGSTRDKVHYLHYKESSTIPYFSHVLLSTDPLTIPKNPKITDNKFYVSPAAYKYLTKGADIAHISDVFKSDRHREFYNELINSRGSNIQFYIDIDINQSDTVLLGARLKTDRVQFFHDGNEHLSRTEEYAFNSATVDSLASQYFSKSVHITDGRFSINAGEKPLYSEEDRIYTKRTSSNNEEVKYYLIIRMLKGLSKNRVWLKDKKFRSQVNPLVLMK